MAERWSDNTTIAMIAANDDLSGARWQLTIAPRGMAVKLVLFNETSPAGREQSLSSYQSVVGFFLMRLACRGVGTLEVFEIPGLVTIDCGVMPPL